jgi:hypothetical protein
MTLIFARLSDGYPVKLQDIGDAPLSRGMGAIKKSLERLVARDKLKPEARRATLQRIAPTTRIEDLSDCDVVVEALLQRASTSRRRSSGTSTRSAELKRSSPPTPPRSRSLASHRPRRSQAAS